MSGRDRISELPESLLTQILSYLPTEQSVQTSVLSKRWENVYLSVPGLDLNCSVIRDEVILSFLSFIDKLLEFSPESSLFKVKVQCRGMLIDGFSDRIGTVIDRGTQHLDVVSSTDYYEDSFGHALPGVDFMPMNLYTSKALVYLKLSSSGLGDPGFVFMPCLRFLHLEEIKWRVHLEKVLSGCPVLEKLTLDLDDDDYARTDEEFMVMRVRSQSLKRFSVLPLRQHMSLGDDQFDSIVVKNLSSLLVVELDIKFFVKLACFLILWTNEIREFLDGISSVGHMIISGMTVHAFEHYSKAGIIPKFNNLSRLEAVFHGKLLQFLPAFLECCPNLKHLILKVVHSEEMDEGLELADVPQCVSSSLECVEIQEKLELEEGKMKATSYFLGNSAVLKKLILSPTAYDPRNVAESEIWRRCEIVIRAMEEVVITPAGDANPIHGSSFVMSGRDRISELPESLLTQILSYLPTNQSVQTSVLSTRWKNLYLSVPGLDLNCSFIRYDADEVFLTFIDKLLEFSPESSLFTVKVKCRDTMIDGFKDRIGTMINRGTQHLDVESSIYYFEDDNSLYPIVDMMPMNLLTSRTLFYLKLSSSGLMDPGFVYMPCLKFMHLEEVKWRVHLEKLLSGCPVLEELTLLRDMDDDYAIGNDEFGVMLVRSQSLKRFSWDYHSRVECTLEIDAPGLEHMSLGDDQFDSIVVKNLSSLFFVKVGVLFNTWNVSKSNEIREFLNGILSVRDMIIFGMTVHAFEHYSKAGIIPKFNNLSRLQVVFHGKLLQFLPAFLECCPNLKHLVLKIVHSEEMEEGLELTDVPRCVSSTLECVEIQEKLELGEGKMKATSYFLANSAVLKKLILSPTAYDPRNVVESEIWEKVNKLTKRSTGCMAAAAAGTCQLKRMLHHRSRLATSSVFRQRKVITFLSRFRSLPPIESAGDSNPIHGEFLRNPHRVMSGIDRISELPESLLTQILSFLPSKQSVQTSVLSTRWKNLYLNVPGLDLNLSAIPYDADEMLLSFLSFIDKLLESSPESKLFKVKVKCRDTMIDGFRDRIGIMIDRGTQHLDVESSTYDIEDDSFHHPCVDFMPMNLYTSKTLVYLKLTSSGLDDPGFVFMPCLKFMHLEEVKWRVHLEKLLSGCPVLEELALLRDLDDDYAVAYDEFTVMRVRAQSLKRFRVLPLRQVRDCRSRVNCTLEIDAPGLKHMSLGEDQFDSIVVKNLTSLLVVELDIKFFVKFGVIFNPWNLAKSNEIRDFLNGISSVRHMIISAKTVKALEYYSQAEMIPKFNNLSRLQAMFHSNLLQFLPAFLECFPNLKHLVLKVVHSEEMGEGLELTDVPRCVSSTLECVEIQEKLELEEGKMKATSYFLGNSAVLKKLILSPTTYDPRDVLESETWEKVNKLTKRSTGCEIIIRAMKEVVII
ncbi:LOW QUALITY PROTEIN: hypothetical protein HID58_083489 [Brassica napus]|uniref:F-box domain-containing protein n=1 Tax=Brassica napus TaxID=3708 RepID=A0ABQ7YG42_BRANA|nr:LOW QUALITY PROTEIN: hypothetical protein HID58_083489 [Brassica napus]